VDGNKTPAQAEPQQQTNKSKPAVPTPTNAPQVKTISPASTSRQVGEERDDNGLKMKLVWCPPGRFTMGSPPGQKDHSRDDGQVPVTLTQGFWLGKYEVTQSEFRRVTGNSPWSGQPYLKEGDAYPASYVTWNDADEFCRKLTEQERSAGRLATNERYRLPTEAEWEYACRAGTTTRYCFGDDERQLNEFAWFAENAINIGALYAHTVGSKKPNAFGLHDMHGNVWEWCADLYGNNLTGGNDPVGAASGTNRVSRGGGWDRIAAQCRSSTGGNGAPNGDRYGSLGFRVARSSDAR
jgi:formylglycine-generating enzyme required for sulfatase activity